MSIGITSFDIFVNPIAKIERTCYNKAIQIRLLRID